MKTGSDVLHLYTEIIPILPAGVIIRIHDIHWPFEYPRSWILEKRWAWNEAYFLRTLLQGSDSLEILRFPNFLAKRHRELMSGMKFPPHLSGSSIWLRKTK